MYNILIVDDEIEILEFIEVYLKNDGYNVLKASNGEDALKIIDNEDVQLAIFDIMMHGVDGLQLCMKVRNKYNIPIIMLSAKSQDMDKINGLSMGADDYITKPFNPMELLARVKAQIRRYFYLCGANKVEDNKDVLEVKDLIINKRNHKVYAYGEEVKLTPTEYKILVLLATERGKIFDSEEIFKSIWKEKYFDGNNTVMAHMWRLREKIEYDPKQPKIIETVWGVGYKIDE